MFLTITHPRLAEDHSLQWQSDGSYDLIAVGVLYV